ncbi:MAG: acyl-CoA dehydrogenase family protein [bacterium]|jgi:acyl-CoA dehydrogenase
MDFTLDEKTNAQVLKLRHFIKTELQPLEEEVEAKGELAPNLAREIFEKSRTQGFYGMNIPAEFGGGGFNAVQMVYLEQEMGQTTDPLVRRAFGNVYEVLLACNEAQRQQWLLPCVKGERTCSIAMTEPEAGSDSAAITATARPDGDGWILNAHKCPVGDGMFSDFYVVSARSEDVEGSRGISLFLVDRSMPGVEVVRDMPMMGLRGSTHVEIKFDNVKLGPEHLLGERGRGLSLLLSTIGRIRLFHIGARAIGMGRRVLKMMTDRANQREQFGKPIGEFQMIQQMLADSLIELNCAHLLVLDAASEIDRGLDPREKVSMVKINSAETLGKIADRAVQLFGAMGYCKDFPLERIYRDCRVLRIYDGTSEIHRMVVSRGLMKKGVDAILGNHLAN